MKHFMRSLCGVIGASLTCAFAAATNALASPATSAVTLNPNDFAVGMSLQTQGTQPFYRVDLPTEVYIGTAYTDLRDLRVFNQDGESLPFALVAPPPATAREMTLPLKLFRLDDKAQNGESANVVVTSRNESVQVQVERDASGRAKVNYLLELRGQPTPPALTGITLQWADMPEAWEDRVTVHGSNDLKTWAVVASNQPLMDLKTNGERLHVNELKFDAYVPRNWTYWRISFGGTAAAPLQGATARYAQQTVAAAAVRLPMLGRAISNTEAEYVLPRPQSLHGLSIVPAQMNAVIPLQIEYRETESGAWKRLASAVAYRLNTYQNEQLPPSVQLRGEIVQAIRLRALSTGWGTTLPTVTAEREPRVLAFNARGNGPYLLAWGARAAGHQALPLSQLVPNLSSFQKLELMPSAYTAQHIPLGGADRLTALAPAERASMWQKGLLWTVLVAGALGLAALAFKLWREMRTQTLSGTQAHAPQTDDE